MIIVPKEINRGDNTHVIELLLEERLGRGEAGEGEDGGGGQLHRWIIAIGRMRWIARRPGGNGGSSAADAEMKAPVFFSWKIIPFPYFTKYRTK